MVYLLNEMDRIVKELGGVFALSDLGKRYSGIGVVCEKGNKTLNDILHYYFEKKGCVVFFNNTPIEVLEKFKDRVYFLAYEVNNKRVEDLGIPAVGAIYFETRTKSRLKQKFKPFEVRTGRVCRGRRCEEIGGLVYVPTWSRNSVLFLCRKDDVIRNIGGVITRPAVNLLFSYLHDKSLFRVIIAVVAPVFG